MKTYQLFLTAGGNSFNTREVTLEAETLAEAINAVETDNPGFYVALGTGR